MLCLVLTVSTGVDFWFS